MTFAICVSKVSIRRSVCAVRRNISAIGPHAIIVLAVRNSAVRDGRPFNPPFTRRVTA